MGMGRLRSMLGRLMMLYEFTQVPVRAATISAGVYHYGEQSPNDVRVVCVREGSGRHMHLWLCPAGQHLQDSSLAISVATISIFLDCSLTACVGCVAGCFAQILTLAVCHALGVAGRSPVCEQMPFTSSQTSESFLAEVSREFSLACKLSKLHNETVQAARRSTERNSACRGRTRGVTAALL